MTRWVAYDEMDALDDIPGRFWQKAMLGGKVIWDPSTVVRRDRNSRDLVVCVPTFTASFLPYHAKTMMMSTQEFRLGSDRQFAVRYEMAVTTFGTQRNPFGVDPGDPRLACALMLVADIQRTGMVLDFLISNEKICTVYERLPGSGGGHPTFSRIAETDVSTHAGQWHVYMVRYDGVADRAEWWVDGKVVCEQSHVGAVPGEFRGVVKVDQWRIGAALFTLTDVKSADTPRKKIRMGLQPLDTGGRSELFGQGAEVALRGCSYWI